MTTPKHETTHYEVLIDQKVVSWVSTCDPTNTGPAGPYMKWGLRTGDPDRPATETAQKLSNVQAMHILWVESQPYDAFGQPRQKRRIVVREWQGSKSSY